MSGRFAAGRGGITLKLDDTETQVVRGMLLEMLALLAPEQREPAGPRDPLEDLVGIEPAAHRPTDPALARLFPDAYRDDEEAATEFRRYTEHGLRERKRGAVLAALASLEQAPRGRFGDSGRRRLDEGQANAWLAALNDLRLTLGERLGVTEDWQDELDGVPEDDPRAYALAVYDFLTYLQETLVRSLMR